MKRLSLFLALGAVASSACATTPPPFTMEGETTVAPGATPWNAGSIMDVLDNAKPWPSTAASTAVAGTASTSSAAESANDRTSGGVASAPATATAVAVAPTPTIAPMPSPSNAAAKVRPKAVKASVASKPAQVLPPPQPVQISDPLPTYPVGAPTEHVGAVSAPTSPRVPAIQRGAQLASQPTAISPMTDGAPPPVNLFSNREASMSAREEKAAALARSWISGDDPAIRGNDGRVMYRFGGPLPTVVCAPLMVCDIELQAGERVQNVDIGDPRFTVSFGLSGSGSAKTVHVRIKPTDTDLVTNLNITTDRRTYVLKLLSRTQDWMPIVAFNYPEDAQAQLMALSVAMAKEEKDTVIPETGQNLNALDFNYKVSGDSPSWRPLRVYTDGKSTYIQFPPQMLNGESPVLVALGDGGQQLVNYRVVGDRYMVDRVLDEAALIVGVGRKQTKVDIRHVGAR